MGLFAAHECSSNHTVELPSSLIDGEEDRNWLSHQDGRTHSY